MNTMNEDIPNICPICCVDKDRLQKLEDYLKSIQTAPTLRIAWGIATEALSDG